MNPDDELSTNVPSPELTDRGFTPDVIEVPGGTKIKSGRLDLSNIRIRYVSQEEYGIDGLLIEPLPGSGLYEFLVSSAGFYSPGGNFSGTVTIVKDDTSLVLQTEANDSVVLQPHSEGGGVATLTLANQPDPGTGTPTANRTIKIWIDSPSGLQAYYLLASTTP